MNIVEQNFELVAFSVTAILIITILKFISGKILGLLIVLILGFNAYYFTMMNRTQQTDVLEHLKKVIDTRGEYVKKVDPLTLLGEDLKLKLKSNDIHNFSELKKHLDETLILNEWKLDKIEKEKLAKEAKEARQKIRNSKN